MADCELEEILKEDKANDMIMTDNEITVTENDEEAEITVIESSDGASSSADSSAVKGHRSVAWCYFDKASDNKSKCTLCGKISKDCGNATNLIKVNGTYGLHGYLKLFTKFFCSI